MARKLDSADTDSSLSPVADDIIEQVESKAEVAPPANSKKRKAAGETTAPKTTKRTKKATATTPVNKKKNSQAPFAERTTDTDLLIGAHVSIAGG